MKKTLAILLTCMLVMTLGSAMAATPIEINATNADGSQTISTGATINDLTDVDITWMNNLAVTYKWEGGVWKVEVDQTDSHNVIAFTVTNSSPFSKYFKARFDSANDLDTKYGLLVTTSGAGFNAYQKLDEASGTKPLDSDTTLTLSAHATAKPNLTNADRDAVSFDIGSIVFTVANNP